MDLLELPYFDGISLDDVVSLVDRMAPVSVAAGGVVVPEGARDAQRLLIVTHGRVRLSKRSPAGKERELAEITAPTLFGEIELLCGLPAVCTARAATDVSAFALDRPTFDQLFAEKHAALTSFCCNVARVACHRLAIADTMLAQVLGDADLVKLRRRVFATLVPAEGDWSSSTTGVFRRR